jgi:hypothetical protein
MLGTSRVLLAGGAVVMAAGGLAAIATGEAGGAVAGIILIACAVPLGVGALYERARYRSGADRDAPSPSGPGGVPSTEPLEPRFRPTGELFVDPSSGRRMRVYVDGATGERRYRAEG